MPSVKKIGFWIAVALVMGNMIGSGIFLLPSSLAPYGVVGLGGWLVSAAGSIALALVFARLSHFDPAPGGPYAFTRLAFGDLAGFVVAWGYWISVWCGNAAIAIAFVGYLEPFIPGVVHVPASAAMAAIVAVWVLTAVNIAGVREAGQVQAVTTVLKIVPLVAVGLAGVVLADATHFVMAPAASHAGVIGALATSVTLTFWAFGGLESATIPAGSIENPERTIPRATIVGTLLCTAIFILGTVGVMGVVAPDTLAAAPAPFADAARAIFGGWAGWLVAAGAAIACFGALNGWILIASQVSLAIASDRLFPRVFSRVSSNGTPVHGLVISSALTTVLIVLNSSGTLVHVFTFLILLGVLAALVPYAFSALAELVLERRRGRIGGQASLRASVIAVLAFGYSLWAIIGSGLEVIGWGTLLLTAGLPVYWLVRSQARQQADRPGSP
jgi:basic amino acid/polyamine antiporter, APA family